MKKFLIKTAVFLLLLATSIYLYIFLLANNAIDPFYYRFTTGKYKSLVLGTSRAAQGIEPGILNEMLDLKDNKIFNYSFTVNRTQWGQPYHNSILKKLDTIKNANGVFILECNLWAFCSKKNQLGNFIESKTAPNNIKNPALEPNIEYFFGGYQHLNFRLLTQELLGANKKKTYVNKHGRFVVNTRFDSMKIANTVKIKMVEYNRMSKEYIPDNLRMLSFMNTIKYLKQFGSVYLIRMPVAEEILQLESSFQPAFNHEMNSVSKELGVPYLDFTFLSNKYITVDGNHIHNQYIDSFNKLLASEIRKSQKGNSELSRKHNSQNF